MPDGLVLESEEKLRAHFWHTGTVDPRSDWTTRQKPRFHVVYRQNCSSRSITRLPLLLLRLLLRLLLVVVIEYR